MFQNMITTIIDERTMKLQTLIRYLGKEFNLTTTLITE